jgi:hypothetical protein
MQEIALDTIYRAAQMAKTATDIPKTRPFAFTFVQSQVRLKLQLHSHFVLLV